jgi:tRNA (guanine-N7-)-methyltransferase
MGEAKSKTFFGRRRGKGMSAAKDSLIALRMGEFEVKVPAGGFVDLASLFGFAPEKISLEIGYGDGEHMAELARKNPNEAFIGAEAFENGNAAMLKKIIEGGLGNARIFPDDAHLLLPHIPDKSIDRLYILYPDPWPKPRHEGRRIVGPKNLPEFARVLKRGGEMLVASDHPAYIAWTLMAMRGQGAFEWTATKSSDFFRAPKNWETTRYEQKAIREGRIPIYLSFRKN